jgi:hypothetical protein
LSKPEISEGLNCVPEREYSLTVLDVKFETKIWLWAMPTNPGDNKKSDRNANDFIALIVESSGRG